MLLRPILNSPSTVPLHSLARATASHPATDDSMRLARLLGRMRLALHSQLLIESLTVLKTETEYRLITNLPEESEKGVTDRVVREIYRYR
jgi:hypothetical protein